MASVLRRAAIGGRLPNRRAVRASDDLLDLPLRRAAHRPLLRRCWELLHTVTSHDAAYSAPAEVSGLVLVTADARLSRAPGITCEVASRADPGAPRVAEQDAIDVPTGR